jgi:peptidoglycan/xylan/chitin deacetylase (PgdA/CDA1 family)
MSQQIILNFHGLGEPPDYVDSSERPYWISAELFEDLVASTAERPEVSYSFDDGNLSDLLVAAPALARHGRVGEFFILTGRLDRPGYLAPEHLHELRDMGMAIGLHGRDHVDWRAVSDGVLHEETVEARQVLSEAAGQPIQSVSIPFGAYNRRVVGHLIRCGFSDIYTSDGGPAPPGARIKNRTSIRSDMPRSQLNGIVAGRSPVAVGAKRRLSTFLRRHII